MCYSLNRFICSIALITACLVSISPATASDAASDIVVDNPYVRAVPPGQPNSAAFMVLQNNGTAAHSIVEAESNVADVVELHTHINEGGMMKMRQVKQIEIPAQGKTSLQPGGLHVMFLGLKSELKPGQLVPVTLIFEDGSNTTLHAPVRQMQMHMKHHGH